MALTKRSLPCSICKLEKCYINLIVISRFPKVGRFPERGIWNIGMENENKESFFILISNGMESIIVYF